MSVVVDASVMIAWQDPGHVFHDVATSLIMGAEPPLYMSELNLAEVLIGLDRGCWTSFVDALVDVGFVFCSPSASDVAQARLDSHLRMPDAYVIATARAQGCDAVISFDEAIIRASSALGIATN